MLDRETGVAAEWRENWGMVVAAFAGMSLAAVAPYSIGILLPAIQHETGWSRTQISIGPTILSLVTMILAPFMGAVLDRYGARRLGLFATTMLSGTLAMMSLATRSPSIWMLLWLLVGLGSAAMPGVWTVPISRRFSQARGLAISIVLSGSGIGASLVPLIAGYGAEHYGWRTAFLMLGASWAIVTLPLILLFYDNRSLRIEAGTTVSDDASGLTVRQAFRSGAFYVIVFAAFGTALAGTALVLNLAPILTDRGLPLATSARIVSTIGIATIVGRLVGGYLMDRIPAYLIATGAAVATVTFPTLLLLAPGSELAATIGVAIFGLTAGPKTTAIVYLARRHFGVRDLGTLTGIVNAAMASGVGLGPLIASAVYDARGSYESVVVCAVPALLFVAALFFTLRFCTVPVAAR